jgi:cellulose synthase/poly-beta-1,6-N-acetylglucosamine synthase-like glycosyltransferase
MILTFLSLLFLLIALYLLGCVLYSFILSVAGKLSTHKNKLSPQPNEEQFNKIAILVPGYKEDSIIESTVQYLLRLDYPKDAFKIYILADSFKPETLQKLADYPIEVLKMEFDKSTKAKSINEAFRRIEEKFDIAIICDADNILKPDFLRIINTGFLKGMKAIQGQRVAKNLDSSYAILDAISEAIGNHIFRKGTTAVGLSSAVIGSGMAFNYELLKNTMQKINAVGGFDKVLQLAIVEAGIKIEYIENAIIFDEKVDNPDAFKNQRSRWVSSQFIYLKRFFLQGFKQLFKGNFSYFNLAILNNIIIPRSFLMAICPVVFIISLFFQRPIYIGLALLINVLLAASILISVPKEFRNKNTWNATKKLPSAVFNMLGTILKIKKANKTFIHTQHTKTEVSNKNFS